MDQNVISPPSSLWTPRRVATATLIVLAIAGVFWMFFRFRLVFFSLFIAVVLSTAVSPLIDRMTRIGIPRPVSIILISLLILLLIVGLVLVVAPLISEQWATISTMISNTYQDVRQSLSNSPSLIIRRLAQRTPLFLPLTPPEQPVTPPVPTPTPATGTGAVPQVDPLQHIFDLSTVILRNVILVMSVLLLTGLWILEGEAATRVMIMGLPASRREGVRDFITDIQNKIGAYTRGLGMLLFIMGALAAIAYAIIGLPNVLLLGLIAGLMEIVPLIGPALGAIPAILVAASVDPTKVVWVVVAYLLIQFFESHFIVPRVMDRAVGVNPVASLLAFIAFGSIFGFLGAVLAVPLAAVIQLVLNRFVFDAPPAEQTPVTGRSVISTLRYEAQDLMMDVRKQVREKDAEVTAGEDRLEDAMEAIAVDLDSILSQSENSQNGNGPNGNGKAVG